MIDAKYTLLIQRHLDVQLPEREQYELQGYIAGNKSAAILFTNLAKLAEESSSPDLSTEFGPPDANALHARIIEALPEPETAPPWLTFVRKIFNASEKPEAMETDEIAAMKRTRRPTQSLALPEQGARQGASIPMQRNTGELSVDQGPMTLANAIRTRALTKSGQEGDQIDEVQIPSSLAESLANLAKPANQSTQQSLAGPAVAEDPAGSASAAVWARSNSGSIQEGPAAFPEPQFAQAEPASPASSSVPVSSPISASFPAPPPPPPPNLMQAGQAEPDLIQSWMKKFAPAENQNQVVEAVSASEQGVALPEASNQILHQTMNEASGSNFATQSSPSIAQIQIGQEGQQETVDLRQPVPEPQFQPDPQIQLEPQPEPEQAFHQLNSFTPSSQRGLPEEPAADSASSIIPIDAIVDHINLIFGDDEEIPATVAKANPELAAFGRLGAAREPVVTNGRIASLGKFLLDRQSEEAIASVIGIGKDMQTARVLTTDESDSLVACLGPIVALPGVAGCLVLGYDGMVVASTLPKHVDRDQFSTWALVTYMHVYQYLGVIGHKHLEQLVARTTTGYLLLCDFGQGLLLTVSDNAAGESMIPLMKSVRRVTAA